MTAEDLKGRATAAGQRTDKPPTANGNGDTNGTGSGQVEKQPPTLAALVTQLKPELARALPRHVSVDRVARIAITALRRTRNLDKCTPESFLGALLTSAQLGLEVNTPAGEAWLIPYGRECTFVLGYKGIVKLFWQHPQAKTIDAQAVYRGDDFDYAYGLEPFLRHKPAPDGQRGSEVTHFYAVATLQNGGSAFVVLTPEQVKALRQGKVGPSGDIADPMLWMERKTALTQMLKLLPKTVELQAALAADEQVRTDYSESLDGMQLHSPGDEARTIDVAAEKPADQSGAEAATGEEKGDGAPAAEQEPADQSAEAETQAPADEQQSAATAAPSESAAETEDIDAPADACPQCGAIPSHSPADCPMGGQ